MNLKIKILGVFCFALACNYGFSQQGHVTINQNKNIPRLLNVKKDMNKDENESNRYKIQIYSGNRSGAQSAQSSFYSSFSGFRPTVQFESPNFKVWAGSFGTRLEADRALLRIKRVFPSAFIFKPKKAQS
ncbi:SPOR domain-containing protein [Changchengzhania lutea]|uniref:SPOR domain-containing protein n=1 Tax=Changchengzhania lutea TaxID=2049305 RepID=UPI00163D95E1|nr:SPOR domain-containing protein [Changchengzhania lutea]